MFRRVLTLGLLAAALAWVSPAAAATAHLFSDDAPLKIVVTAPFKDLVRTAKTSTNLYPATLAVTDGAGAAQTLAIQLRARGMTRRTGGYCDFPPLQLNFGDKATLKGTLFHGQHKLKLVTYCRDLGNFEQRIVLEYLAYRLYNMLTPMSFRVRAAEVTYRNGANEAGVTRFGFLIEDLRDLAERNDLKPLKLAIHQLTPAQFDAHAAGRAALFELLISNVDWDFLAAPAGFECCHNSRFIAASDKDPLKGVAPIPYDFDYSGLVDAPYAGPAVGLPVDKVTDRIYRGYCVSSGEIPALVEEFRAHRAEMMALIADYPQLGANVRTKTTHFLEGFFSMIDNPARVDMQIVHHCRTGAVTH